MSRGWLHSFNKRGTGALDPSLKYVTAYWRNITAGNNHGSKALDCILIRICIYSQTIKRCPLFFSIHKTIKMCPVFFLFTKPSKLKCVHTINSYGALYLILLISFLISPQWGHIFGLVNLFLYKIRYIFRFKTRQSLRVSLVQGAFQRVCIRINLQELCNIYLKKKNN